MLRFNHPEEFCDMYDPDWFQKGESHWFEMCNVSEVFYDDWESF